MYDKEVTFLGLGRGYPPLDLCQAVPGTRASTMERHCAMGFRNRYFDDAFRNLCRYPFFSDSPEKASHRNSIPEKAVPVASSGRPLFRIVHLDVDIQRVYVVGSSAAMDIESPRATQCPG